MTKVHKITELADFVKLTPEEFARMIPDFVTWYSFAKTAPVFGVLSCGFDWFDDGQAGEVHSISVNGEVISKGPAYKEPAP